MYKFVFIVISILVILTGCSKRDENSENSDNNIVSENVQNNTQNVVEPKEEEISSYSSPILISDVNRQNNVQLTCSTLNGTIVKPETEFSFCTTVGQATPEAGYAEAEMFDSEGEIILGYGGGKCQVSSTLYNAVLALPMLEVTERSPHSHKVDYVPEGKDATVAYGSVDFKFINHYAHDIKIIAEATEQNVTIKILKVE